MSRPAIRNAVGVVGAAAALGLAGQLLFFDVGARSALETADLD